MSSNLNSGGGPGPSAVEVSGHRMNSDTSDASEPPIVKVRAVHGVLAYTHEEARPTHGVGQSSGDANDRGFSHKTTLTRPRAAHKRRETADATASAIAEGLSTLEIDQIIDNRKRRKSDETDYRTQNVAELDNWQHLMDPSERPHGSSALMLTADMTIDFFNEVKLLYSMVDDELCTSSSCREARGVQLLLERIDRQVENEDLFPVDAGKVPYAPNFVPMVKQIYKGICRVYLHLYQFHYAQFLELKADKHLNTCCQRLSLFLRHNDMLTKQDLDNFHRIVMGHIKAGAS